jgi:pimeloyl-ACP methyl ester carboxylesterase
VRISRVPFFICAVATLVIGYYTVRAARAFLSSYGDYHPPREQIAHPAGKIGSRLQDVAIETDDGTRVAGWLLPSSNGAVIIFLHGSPGNRKQLLPVAVSLNEHGYGALLLDMPGHGESGGSADWGVGSYNTVKRAIDLASKGAGIRHIALFGYSMGSFIAVQIAAQELRVNALVLLAPFTNLADEIRYQFQSHVPFLSEFSVLAARMAGVPVDDMRTVDILKATTSRPVLIIAGTEDSAIPVSMSRELFRAAHEPKELWLVYGANHGDLRDTAGSVVFDERVRIFLDTAFGSDVDLAR